MREKIEITSKPIKAKPQFYATCFESLQKIAREGGYNLLIHGSLDRDFDLVAVPWIDSPISHLSLLHLFCDYLGVRKSDSVKHYLFTMQQGGRSTYAINLYRNKEDNTDAQYYLDISITPLPSDTLRDLNEKLCMEKDCISEATIDYNGHGHMVCDYHYKKLSDCFDEEYK